MLFISVDHFCLTIYFYLMGLMLRTNAVTEETMSADNNLVLNVQSATLFTFMVLMNLFIVP